MNIIAIPAFSDNYIWMLHNEQEAIVIDPGEATPVISTLKELNLELSAILITHHHKDHTGGIDELRPYLKNHDHVFGPAKEDIPAPFTPVQSPQILNLLGLTISILDVPGHTAGHIAYYIPTQIATDNSFHDPILFAGDTLFSAGCGRIFEGSPAQLLTSLDLLASLPAQTQVYSAHEYTLSNLRFAATVEPDNAAIRNYSQFCEQLRTQNKPTLPTSIAQELEINPFLRSRKQSVIKSVKFYNPQAQDELTIFAALRSWKDNFK